MTNRAPIGRDTKEKIVTEAIKDVISKGESDIRCANASKVSREVNLPERTTRHLIRNDQEVADIAEIRLKYLSNRLQDLRIKLSDILDEKLSDLEEVKRTSLYQAMKAYCLLVDKEILLLNNKHFQLEDDRINKIEVEIIKS